MSQPPKNQNNSAVKTLDTIEGIIGKFPGYRRAHARGRVYKAVFKPTGKALDYTSAPHLTTEEVQSIVRFSHSSPDPTMADSLSPIKGMAVKLLLPEGKEANFVGATVPIFVTKTPEAFLEMLQIGRSLKNGRPRLKSMVKLVRNHPESKTALKLYRKVQAPSSFATGHYYLIHVYYLVNNQGRRQPVKFKWEPVYDKKKEQHKENCLEDELDNRLVSDSVRFRLCAQLGEQEDPVDDPTKEWPEDRKIIPVGDLVISEKLVETKEDILFDPTVTGEGIECSEDEILHFRSHLYATSHQLRSKQE